LAYERDDGSRADIGLRSALRSAADPTSSRKDAATADRWQAFVWSGNLVDRVEVVGFIYQRYLEWGLVRLPHLSSPTGQS
jgi:hypothetical protein